MVVSKKVDGNQEWETVDTAAPHEKSGQTNCTLSQVTTVEAFADLAEDWLALETQVDETFSYFQTFGWCFSWWKNVGKRQSASLRIFLLRRNEQLVAVWPLQITKVGFGADALTPLTYPHSEYSSALFDHELSNEERRKFVDEVLSSTKCDLVVLPKMPSGSSLESLTKDFGVTAPIEEVASMFEPAQFDGEDHYLRSLSGSTRRNRAKRRNKLARLGEVKYEVFHPDSEKFGELVRLAFEMKFDWLTQTGRNDAKLKIEGLCDTILGLAADWEAANALVQALTVDGKPVAMEVGLQLQGHYYSYIGAFDWGMRDYSVGKIQIEQAILWAIKNRIDRYDLLAEPAGYKDSWSNYVVTLQNRTIARSTKGYLFGVVWQHHLRPRVKTFFNSMPAELRTKALGLKKLLAGE